MLYIIKFFVICVVVYLSKSPVLSNENFIQLDISNISADFTVTKKKNYNHIVVSEELKTQNKVVGKVVDGTLLISENPDPKVTDRYVRIVKYPSSGNHNPDLEEAVKRGTEEVEAEVSSQDESGFTRIVEIHSFLDYVMILDRYAKNQNGEYVRYDFEHEDVDICDEITNKIKINDVDYYNVENFKTVGEIKCKNKILLDGLNIFYRTIEIHDNDLVVNTVPNFGVISDVSFDLGKKLQQKTTKRADRRQLSLKLDRISESCAKILSTCGNDCMFFDGCNEKTTLVNVQENNQLIYSNPNTLCISVKTEESTEGKYITIYDKPKNSMYFLVKVYKRGINDTAYSEHVKKPVEVEVSSDPRTRLTEFTNLLISETIAPNTRYRIKHNDYRIGRLYLDGNLLLGDADIIYNREIYANDKGIIVFDQYYNGESNRYLFRPDGSGSNNPADLSRAGKIINLNPEYSLKIDLNNIPQNITKYATVSNDNLFVKTNSFVEKLGSLTFNDFMVCPNRFYVSNQYMIINNKEFKLYSVTRRGYSFQEAFVKVPSFVNGESIYVSKAKEVVKFDVMEFYNSVVGGDPEALPNFEFTDLGDYMLVGTRYKYLFDKIIGNVEVSGKVIAPLDTDLSSRQLILPMHTQSFFILRDCDVSECWHKTFKETSANGHVGYEIQPKTGAALDLVKIFVNDNGQSVFTFDYFVVYKYGTVYTVRILNDLEHKIGKILWNGLDLLPDTEHVFSRMINISVNTENNADVNGQIVKEHIEKNTLVTGSLRILEIEKWDKTSRFFTYEIKDQTIEARGKHKTAFELDIEPLVRTNQNLNISSRNDVMTYQMNWNVRDDYRLGKIKCSTFESNKWVATNFVELSEDFPVFVRLHRDDPSDTNKIVTLAIENHHGFEKPKSGQLFKRERNAAKKGFILKYSIKSKQGTYVDEHSIDSYYRRNFTPFRHTFHVDGAYINATVQGVQSAQAIQVSLPAQAAQPAAQTQPQPQPQTVSGVPTGQATGAVTGQATGVPTTHSTGGTRGRVISLASDSEEEEENRKLPSSQ